MAIIGSTYLKVPAGLIPSTLADFVHKVDLSKLTDSFWNNVDAVGAFVRVKNDAGTDLPFDLIYLNTATRCGLLFFKATLTAGQINEYRIVVDNAVAAPAVTDTLGRNAVWSDYDCFFVGSAPSVNRTGAATTQANLTAGTAQNFGWLPFSPASVDVHQGIAWDGAHYYLIDTNAIFKYNADWEIVASNMNPLAAMRTASGFGVLNHLGDGTIKDGELFIVVEEYPATPYDSQIIAVINISDLSLNRVYNISAQAHEVSSITWDPVNGYFVITDFTASGNTTLHKYSEVGAYLGTITMGSVTSKQSISYYNNRFYMIGSSRILSSIALDGSDLVTESTLLPTAQQEGMCSLGDGSFAVLFDGTPSAIWRAVPNANLTVDYPTWLNTGNTAPFRCSGLPKRTVWTCGASVIPFTSTGNMALLSYSDNSNTSANRATIAMRSGSVFGAWNSIDSWLDNSLAYSVVNHTGYQTRVHHSFNGTTDRKIYRQGDLEATDAGTSQRPAGTGDTLFVGVEDSSPDERFYGLINFVYLRNGVLSTDWLKAEYRSWEQESMFAVSDTAQADADFLELNATIGTDTDPSSGAPGWAVYGGLADMTTSSRGTGIAAPAYGARFWRAAATTRATARQDIDVSAHASRIDNGDVLATLTASVVSDFSVALNDKGSFYLEFYDGSSNLIKRVRSRWRQSTATSTWMDLSVTCVVPAGTRTIRRAMEARRYDGSDSNVGLDIEKLVLYAPEVGTPPDPGARRRNVAMMIG